MIDGKSFILGFVSCLAFAILAFIFVFPANANSDCAKVEPVFSPGSSEEIISLIRSSQNTIDLEMYVFTDENIARELSDAAGRGVRVRVILEDRTGSYNLEQISKALESGGAQLRWASHDYQLTHAKMMVVDGKKVLVGSINFSKAAQTKNREAAAIIEGNEVQKYIDVFEKDWKMASSIN